MDVVWQQDTFHYSQEKATLNGQTLILTKGHSIFIWANYRSSGGLVARGFAYTVEEAKRQAEKAALSEK